MTKHTFRFNLENNQHVDLDLTKEQFEKLSELCEKEFPEKNWKTKTVKAIEV